MYLENFHAKLDWRLPTLFLILLLPLSWQYFTLFHTLAEGVAIAVAIMAFVVAYNTYPFSQTHFLMYLGCGYFWVGVLDIFHLVTSPRVLEGLDARYDASVQFWLMARFVEATVLLTLVYMIDRVVERRWVFSIFGAMAAVMMTLVFTDRLPLMMVGEGADMMLSDVKVMSEYVIIAMLVLAGWQIWWHRARFNESVVLLFLWSIGLTIAAEISFTVNSGVMRCPVPFTEGASFSCQLVLGHVFKLLSFWIIYVALVESSLTQPFKSLSLSSDTFNALPDAIVVVDSTGRILHANESARDSVADDEEIVGKTAHDVFHNVDLPKEHCRACASIEKQISGRPVEVHSPQGWFEITLSAINYYGQDNVMLHVCRDINARKEALLNYETADRLYNVLRLTNKAIISARSKQDLLDVVCNIAVREGGFSMAWIGMIENDQVVPVSSAGDCENYLDDLQVRLDGSELAKGPVGIAIGSFGGGLC